MRGAFVAMMVALVALAGCSDDPKAQEAEDDVFAGLEGQAEATTTTGAIAGVVVDEAIRPLGNASVTLLSTGTNVTTDGEGRFAFERLEPGAYFVQAGLRRYDGAQVSVDVVAGEVSTVRILLVRLAGSDPYHITQNFRGHIDNYAGFANFAVEVLAPGTLGCTCAWDLPVDPNLMTVMVEASGQVAVPNPGTPGTVPGDAYWEVFAGGVAGDLRDSAYDEFPLVKRFTNETFEGHEGTIGVRITCGVWPCVTMDYDLFVTVWYHEEAPEGWSFLNGDT